MSPGFNPCRSSSWWYGPHDYRQAIPQELLLLFTLRRAWVKLCIGLQPDPAGGKAEASWQTVSVRVHSADCSEDLRFVVLLIVFSSSVLL